MALKHCLFRQIVQQEIISNKVTDEQQSDDEYDQFSTIKRSPRDAEKKSDFTNNETQENTMKNNIINQETAVYKDNKYNTSEHMQQITDQQFVDEVIYQDFADGPGLQARALYDYQAGENYKLQCYLGI